MGTSSGIATGMDKASETIRLILGTAEDASDYSTLLAVAADVVNLRNEILSSL
jgi:hypothetical protein